MNKIKIKKKLTFPVPDAHSGEQWFIHKMSPITTLKVVLGRLSFFCSLHTTLHGTGRETNCLSLSVSYKGMMCKFFLL